MEKKRELFLIFSSPSDETEVVLFFAFTANDVMQT